MSSWHCVDNAGMTKEQAACPSIRDVGSPLALATVPGMLKRRRVIWVAGAPIARVDRTTNNASPRSARIRCDQLFGRSLDSALELAPSAALIRRRPVNSATQSALSVYLRRGLVAPRATSPLDAGLGGAALVAFRRAGASRPTTSGASSDAMRGGDAGVRESRRKRTIGIANERITTTSTSTP